MVQALFWCLAAVPIVILVLALAVVCMPMEIKAENMDGHKPVLTFKISMLGGLVVVPIDHDRRFKNPSRGKKKQHPMKSKSGPAFDWKMDFRNVPKLILKIIKRIKIKAFNAVVRFGFPDPADTGSLYGLVVPLSILSNQKDAVNITLQPDFGNTRFEGELEFVARFIPLLILGPLVGLGLAVFIAPRFR